MFSCVFNPCAVIVSRLSSLTGGGVDLLLRQVGYVQHIAACGFRALLARVTRTGWVRNYYEEPFHLWKMKVALLDVGRAGEPWSR